MKKYTQEKKIFLLMEEEAEADFLPPEREATEEDLYIEKILAEDENQRRWEAEARRAGVI